MNEMQREGFCRQIGERARNEMTMSATKNSLINRVIEPPKVKYDFVPNTNKLSVDEVVKHIESMEEFNALTPSAKRRYIENTFKNER